MRSSRAELTSSARPGWSARSRTGKTARSCPARGSVGPAPAPSRVASACCWWNRSLHPGRRPHSLLRRDASPGTGAGASCAPPGEGHGHSLLPDPDRGQEATRTGRARRRPTLIGTAAEARQHHGGNTTEATPRRQQHGGNTTEATSRGGRTRLVEDREVLGLCEILAVPEAGAASRRPTLSNCHPPSLRSLDSRSLCSRAFHSISHLIATSPSPFFGKCFSKGPGVEMIASSSGWRQCRHYGWHYDWPHPGKGGRNCVPSHTAPPAGAPPLGQPTNRRGPQEHGHEPCPAPGARMCVRFRKGLLACAHRRISRK